MEKMFIDMTPTWAGLLPSMLEVLENPTASHESKTIMREELARMAQGADAFNTLQKERKNAESNKG
jgi:hypothetical protein